MCGSHVLQAVTPILTYVDQLQKELRSNECEIKQKEINEMRKEIQELKVKEAAGKFKDNLILSKETQIKNLEKFIDDLALSKDTLFKDLEKLKDDVILSKDAHFKDLEKVRDDLALSKDTRIKDLEMLKDDIILGKDALIKDLETKNTELQKINNEINQNFEKVNKEIVELKAFIRKELDTVLSKHVLNVTKFQHYEDQLKKYEVAISENVAQLKSKDVALQGCQVSLNKTQKDVHEFQDKFETYNTSISEFSKLTEIDSMLQEKEQELFRLKEQILKMEELATSCSFYGDSNIHNIKLPNFGTFPVLCNSDIAGPGWTVIQQRINGKEDFNRSWEAYKNGFGNLTGDFFLGLEKIHRLTVNRANTLYIYMERFAGTSFYARYSKFTIAGEDDKYRLLSLGHYSGTADRDRMRKGEHQKFTTFDSQNDIHEDYNCAENFLGGWWYKGCADW